MTKSAVFLDNAETTRVDPLVIEAVNQYMLEKFGLPSSEFGYRLQEEALEALEKSRQVIAQVINSEPEEIVFTSGATESNNLSIKGIAYSGRYHGERIVTSKIEQYSVLNVIRHMETRGFQSLFLDVNEEGFVDLGQLEKNVDGSCLVSIQHANQEIGTLQNLHTIGEICRERNVIFHCDAAQSFAKEPIDVKKMKIDVLSMTSHLLHGPKGVGALYVREGVKLHPLIEGDDRERGLRAGSQNIPGIVGFALAVGLMKQEDLRRMVELRDDLIRRLLNIKDTNLNGPGGKRRLCNNINVTFLRVEGESLTLHADMKGLIVNTGSACYSSRLEPSHVIRAIGGTHEEAHGSTRLSLSKWTTSDEVKFAAEVLEESVENLRAFSAISRDVKP